MLEGNSPNCSRLPHRYAISSPFFAAYFIISSAVLTDLFFDATNFSSHHNNCDTVSRGGDARGHLSVLWLRPWGAKSDILPLRLTDCAIAFKGFAFVFQSQQCFDSRAAKRVGQHLRPVAQDEQRIMSESHRQMANLHPSLGAPS